MPLSSPTARPEGPAYTRSDTSAIEPRYLALLEGERPRWWNRANFRQWRNLYVSEYHRGFVIMETVARHVSGFRPQGSRVLDIGCGDAGVPIAFAERGARAAGIEASQASVDRGQLRAQEHGVDIDLRQGFAERLPWADGSFDLVVLDNVLEHVNDQARTLQEIRRVLMPGGLAYVVTPKPFALASIVSDPHYQLAGLTLMPPRMQRWYFERVRGGGRGNFGVGVIPTRAGVRRLLRATDFRELTDARQMWIEYLRGRIAEPGEVRPSKRRLAGWLGRSSWVFRNPGTRLLLDLAMGSNIFIARRAD